MYTISMTIEADPNPMPQFRVMPPMAGIAAAIKRAMSLGTTTEPCLSEHIRTTEVPNPGQIGGVAIRPSVELDAWIN